jgi:O-antigen ligase
MFLVLVNVIPFSQYLNTRKGMKAWFFLFVFCCGAVSVLRTYSRGSFVSFPLSIAITFFISVLLQFKARKTPRILIILVLGIVGFLIFLPKIILRFENAGEASGITRKNFAKTAMNIIRDKPYLGVGVNNWSLTLQRNREYVIDRETGETMNFITDGIVETVYLLVAAECGIPCLVILICWFMYYFLISLKLAFNLRHSRYFFIPAATAGGLLGIYTQSLLEWVLKQQMNLIFLIMIFAMLSYLNRHYKMLIKMEQEEDREEEKKAAEKQLDASSESTPAAPAPSTLPALQ